MAMQVGELFASFSLDTSGFAQAIVGIEGDLEQMGARITSIGSGFEHYLTAPVKSFAESTLNAGMNFSAQMSAVEAISGAVGEELGQLRQAAIDAGSETSFTATQAGEALQYMAMAGWQTEDMLSGLRPIMDLAAASGANLATTSDIVTDAMTAMGYSAKDNWQIIEDGTAVDTGISNVQHFADVLAAAATSSNTNVEMMGESFKYAAPLAGALGYSVEDVAAVLGLMANQGIKASQAGTTLRSLFKRLADPPKAARAAMEAYGISLTDTEGKIKSLGDFMEELRAKAAGMTEVEKAAFASDIAGATGMSGFLALLNASTEDYEQLTTAINGCTDATGNMAGTMMDNARGAMTILNSAVEGLQITLFSLFEGGIRDAAAWMTDLVNAFRNADAYVQKATVAFLGLTAGIGPAVKAFGMLLPALAGMVTPIGALTAGLGLFALSFMDFATAAGGSLDESGNYVARGAGKIETAIREMAAGALPKLQRFSVMAESYIWSVADYMPGMIGALQESVRTLLPDAVSTMITLLGTTFAGVAKNLNGILDLGTGIISGILSGVARAAPKLMTNLSRIMAGILTTFTDVDRLRQLGSTISEAFRSAFDGTNWAYAGNLLTTALDTAVGNIRQMAEEMNAFLSSLDLSGFGQRLQEGLAGAGGWLKAALLGEDFEEGTWGDVGAAINGWIRTGFERIGTWLAQLILGDDFTDGSTWMDAGKRVWEWIRAGFETTSDFLLGLILGENFNTQTSRWTDAGFQVWNWIKAGFESTSDFLLNLILGDNFNSTSTWSDAGRKIWADIRSGFDGAVTFLKDLIMGGEGSEADWADIGARIGGWIQSGLSSLSNFLYSIIIGEDSTAGGWYAAGARIGGLLRDGMAGVGEYLKGIVLGEDYTSGSTWVDAGEKIWNWIRSGFEYRVGLLEGAIFGSDGTGQTDWTAKGQRIWELIQAGFTFAGNFLARILGVEGEESADWTRIGAAIWEKIKAGFDASGHFLEGVILGENATGEGWVSIGRTIWKGIEDGLSAAGDYLERALWGEENGGVDWQARGRKVAEDLRSGMDALKNLLASLLGLEGDAATDWKQVGATIFEGILGGLNAAATAAGDFLTGLIMGEQGAETTMLDLGVQLFTSLRNGLISGMTTLGSLAGSLAEEILRFEWVPVGIEIGAGLLKGIMDALTALREGMEQVLQQIFLGVKYAVLSWFGIEVDEMTRIMESTQIEIDGEKFTAAALSNMICSASTTISERARAWVALVEAGFEAEANAFDFSPTAVALANQVETGLLEGKDKIMAAAALIFSGFGDTVMAYDLGLYEDGLAMMQELYRGIEKGTDVTREMCETLGLTIPETIAEAIGAGDWQAPETAVTGGMQTAMENLSAEADALIQSLGQQTAETYIETINDGLANGTIDGEPVKSALESAATNAAEATGSEIGQTVMTAAARAIDENQSTLTAGAAAATEPSNFGQAEVNASAAGSQIGGAIAPEITARIAEVEAAIAAVVETIGSGFLPVSEALKTSMDEAMAGIVESISASADPIREAIETLVAEIQAAFRELTIDLSGINGLSGSVHAGGNPGVAAEGTDISGTVSGIVEQFGKLSGQLEDIIRNEMDSVQRIMDGAALSMEETTALLRDALTGIWAELAAALNEMTESMYAEMEEHSQRGADALKQNTTALYTELESISGSGSAKLISMMQRLVQQLESIYTPIRERLTAITREAMIGMETEVDTCSSQLTGQVSSMTVSMENAAYALVPGLTGIASEAMEGMTGAVNAGAGSLSGAAGSAASMAVGSARSAMSHDQGYSIGENFASGIRSGMESASGSLVSAAKSVVNGAVTAIKSALKISSPSKVTMEIGEYMDEGIAEGLAGGKMVLAAGSAVEDAVHAMADAASISDVSRGTVHSSETQARETGAEAARAMEKARDESGLAERVAAILADRLIASGALGGDVYMDGSKVGQCVATPVSRRINEDVRHTVRGRRAAGVLG